ncbi:MAG: acyltransferase [Oscillospiraceae bacterium]|nr:acyltransferase [Oscillospiraceae bacterium]
MNNAPDERVPLLSLDRRKSTILRGVAILYVLLGHAKYIAWGGVGGVTLFLLLSGYGLEASFEDRGLENYWRRRFFKVWLPYMIVGVFNVLILHVEGSYEIFCTVVGLDFYMNADKTMWYISYILFWYAAFYPLALLTRRAGDRRIGTAVRLAGLFLFSYVFYRLSLIGVWDGTSGAKRYVIFFPLGAALCALGRVQVKEWIRTLVWPGLFFLSTVYMVISYGMTPWTWKYALFGALQVLAASQFVHLGGAAERALLWLGKYSYPIYLFEWTVFRRREQWLGMLKFQPLIDLGFILLTALFAFVFWEANRRFEELAAYAIAKRKAL